MGAIGPYDGEWMAMLGGCSEITRESVSQHIDITGLTPDDEALFLHFRYWLSSSDPECNLERRGGEWFVVGVATGPATADAAVPLCTASNTNGWAEGVVDYSGLAGAPIDTLAIVFTVRTDSDAMTSRVFLDAIYVSREP